MFSFRDAMRINLRNNYVVRLHEKLLTMPVEEQSGLVTASCMKIRRTARKSKKMRGEKRGPVPGPEVARVQLAGKGLHCDAMRHFLNLV